MKTVLAFAFAALTLLACGPAEDNSSETSGLISTSKKWPNPKAIPVCFENHKAVSNQIIDDIAATINKEYKKVSIGFTGWGVCSEADYKSAVIRIHFHLRNDHPVGGGLSHVGPVSTPCDDQCGRGTMRLDVNEIAKYPPLTDRLHDWVIQMTRRNAIHEFAHAVGLHHEHERNDAPVCLDKDGNPYKKYSDPATSAQTGGFDAQSVTSYCQTSKIPALSEGDIDAIGTVYPELPRPVIARPVNLYRETDDKAVYRQLDKLKHCYLQNPDQVAAYGGFPKVKVYNRIAMMGENVGKCAWPSGLYRLANDIGVVKISQFSPAFSLAADICWVKDEVQLGRLGGPSKVNVVDPASDLPFGLKNLGLCKN